MFQALRERMPLAPAALIGGAAFGIVHLPGGVLLSVLVLTAFGVVLCLVLWKTGSLLPCIALHALTQLDLVRLHEGAALVGIPAARSRGAS